MYETTVTLQGWLGGEVTTRTAGDSVVASFRVAMHPAPLPALDRDLGRRADPVVRRDRLASPGGQLCARR